MENRLLYDIGENTESARPSIGCEGDLLVLVGVVDILVMTI